MKRGAPPVYTTGLQSPYKDGVYQSIDDSPAPDGPDAAGRGRPWLWAALAAVLLILAAAWLLRPAPQTGTTDPIMPEPEARQNYLKALGEQNPALRRARLTDFLTQHPDNPRSPAARAQLAVLDGAADKDWQATLTTAYDPRIAVETRLAAVEAYRESWGRYLGARDGEIEALVEDIRTTPVGEDAPDRTLQRDESRYAGIPNDRLAGGTDRYRDPRVTFRPSREFERERPVADTAVIPPRVRRNATPRYPHRALRRGEEAIVTLALTIDEDGRVAETELIDVEARRYANDFINAAERAALRTRFDPQTVGGIPVEARGVEKRYRFELE